MSIVQVVEDFLRKPAISVVLPPQDVIFRPGGSDDVQIAVGIQVCGVD